MNRRPAWMDDPEVLRELASLEAECELQRWEDDDYREPDFFQDRESA